MVLDDDVESLLPGRLDERERAWWDKWHKELPTIAKRPKELLVTDRKRRKIEARMKVERNLDAPATVADIEVNEKGQQEEIRILIRVCNVPRTSCREADAHT